MLTTDSILTKTQKGTEEIETRAHHLSPKLRAALIMIDGASTLGETLERCGEFAENIEQRLNELVEAGFVEVANAEQEAPVHDLRNF